MENSTDQVDEKAGGSTRRIERREFLLMTATAAASSGISGRSAARGNSLPSSLLKPVWSAPRSITRKSMLTSP